MTPSVDMNTRASPQDIVQATAGLQPLFTYLAYLLHQASGEDLSSDQPTPELFARVHGCFDVLSRSLRAEGTMPPYFDGVFPAFRHGSICTDFRLSEGYRSMLPAMSKEA